MGADKPGAHVLELTLEDAVRLALRNNRSLQSARLGRGIDKLSLDVAEDRYRPMATIGATANFESHQPTTAALAVGPSLRVPSGGELSLRWSEPLEDPDGTDGTWTLGFSQPLLKGFGPGVDTAPLRIARLAEKMKVLEFRDTVAGTVTSVVRAYRRVIREQRAIAISRESLARAKRQIEINRSLIRAGRMAEREIIQSEAELANRELAVAESENSLISAIADLVSILDVDDVSRVVALDETLSVERRQPDPERSIETALGNRGDYLSAQMRKESAEIELLVAENERLWDLRLNANVSRDDENGRNYAAGLRLSVPLGDDRSKKLRLVGAQNGVRNAEIALMERLQSIRIEVRQATHDVKVGFRRIELARKARELAERQLDVEQTKFAQGLSSAYQLTSVEDDLVRAQNRELNAVISYQNALTSLDQALGTTLRSWKIDIETVESGKTPSVLDSSPGPAVRPDGRSKSPDPPVRPRVAAAFGLDRWMSPFEPPRRAVEAEDRALAGHASSGATPRRRDPVTERRILMLSLDEFELGTIAPRAMTTARTAHRTDAPAHETVQGSSPANAAGRPGSRARGHATGDMRPRQNDSSRPAPAPLPAGLRMLTAGSLRGDTDDGRGSP